MGLGDHNYFRNPDLDRSGVWCMTTDPDDYFGYCDIGTTASYAVI